MEVVDLRGGDPPSSRGGDQACRDRVVLRARVGENWKEGGVVGCLRARTRGLVKNGLVRDKGKQRCLTGKQRIMGMSRGGG